MGSIEKVESAGAAGFQIVRPSLDGILASGLVADDSRWCCWQAQWAGRPKPAKVPMGEGGRRLSVSKAEGWLSFDAASRLFSGGGFDGIGVLMPSLNFVVGLDLDCCLCADGSVLESMSQVVDDFLALGGYCEVSPSGTGLRQFVLGCRLEDYREKTGPLEIYDEDSARYLTLTGTPYPVGSPAGSVVQAQGKLEAFIVNYMERIPDAPPLEFDSSKFGESTRTAGEVLQLLRGRNKRGRITRLLAGDLIDYEGGHSEADAALCFEAAYFCRSPEVIDAILRGSKLMRPKWDEARGRETYGQRTIRNAIKAQTQNHDHDQNEKQSSTTAAKEDRAQLAGKAADNLVGGLQGLVTARNQLKSDVWTLTELLVRDRRLLGVCHYDEFSGFPVFNRALSEVMADKSAPSETGRIDDSHLLAFLRWFGREWGLSLKMDQIKWAVFGLAQAVKLNPVKFKLNELEAAWDKVPRLDDWLIRYLKASTVSKDGRDISEYLSAIGSRWVISAVARAIQPGCKADCMLILEGRQGYRKSSAVRALTEAIGIEYHREGFQLGAGKDDQVALRGRLIVEWSELGGMSRHDRNSLKTFLALQDDSYRQGYAIFEKDWPRTAIFCGTTNEGFYLSDPTGNRRFWPATVGHIDLDALRKDAPMIWAEAVSRYKAGERWWFDDADPRDIRLLAMAEREQSGRVGGTFWSEVAADLADRLILGQLSTLDRDGNINEALPRDGFSVQQMRAWLATQTGGGRNNQGEVQINDSNWPRVCDGLRLAGWDSKKSNGIMRWFLAPERRDELCQLHGREVGPAVSAIRRLSRKSASESEPEPEPEPEPYSNSYKK